MQKMVLLFVLSCFMFSCETQSQKEETSIDTEQEISTTENQEHTARTNYAVIWKWETDDIEFVTQYLPSISKELASLWESDVIENAYFDTEATIDKLGHLANVAFFLKASSREEAQSILNNLTVVKKKHILVHATSRWVALA